MASLYRIIFVASWGLGALSLVGSVVLKLVPAWREGVAAGALSLGAYWIVVWAFTQAPIALVVALRETSVLFAMLIAVFMLREKAGRWRWAAAALIVGGVVLIRV